jgi:RNA polymerase sigma-70 factor (family 1)
MRNAMPSISNNNALAEVAAGNFKAYEAIFHLYYASLCQHAYSFVGDAALAEDAVSEVFVRIWEKRQQLEVNTSVKSYLYRSVANQCIDGLRKAYHKKLVFMESVSENLAHTSSSHAADYWEHKELAAEIEQAIRRLPKQCGIIFRLSKEAGLKYGEIARLLNISVKTVETQMGRAFKALRIYLQPHRQVLASVAG